MKKPLALIIVLLISKFVLCQISGKNFECQIKPGYQGFTNDEIIKFVSKLNLENYRLQDKRTTLSFNDNGFDITLLSANEMVVLNLIPNSSAYPVTFPKDYYLPVFNMENDGRAVTIYKPVNIKFKKGK